MTKLKGKGGITPNSHPHEVFFCLLLFAPPPLSERLQKGYYSGADPEFFPGGGAKLRNCVTDW